MARLSPVARACELASELKWDGVPGVGRMIARVHERDDLRGGDVSDLFANSG
jgi:hypothetical protein